MKTDSTVKSHKNLLQTENSTEYILFDRHRNAIEIERTRKKKYLWDFRKEMKECFVFYLSNTLCAHYAWLQMYVIWSKRVCLCLMGAVKRGRKTIDSWNKLVERHFEKKKNNNCKCERKMKRKRKKEKTICGNIYIYIQQWLVVHFFLRFQENSPRRNISILGFRVCVFLLLFIIIIHSSSTTTVVVVFFFSISSIYTLNLLAAKRVRALPGTSMCWYTYVCE